MRAHARADAGADANASASARLRLAWSVPACRSVRAVRCGIAPTHVGVAFVDYAGRADMICARAHQAGVSGGARVMLYAIHVSARGHTVCAALLGARAVIFVNDSSEALRPGADGCAVALRVLCVLDGQRNGRARIGHGCSAQRVAVFGLRYKGTEQCSDTGLVLAGGREQLGTVASGGVSARSVDAGYAGPPANRMRTRAHTLVVSMPTSMDEVWMEMTK